MTEILIVTLGLMFLGLVCFAEMTTAGFLTFIGIDNQKF